MSNCGSCHLNALSQCSLTTALYKPNEWQMEEDEYTLTQMLVSAMKNPKGLTEF